MTVSRVVLTVRCTECRKPRGYVVAHAGHRLWALPATRTDSWPGGRRPIEVYMAARKFPAVVVGPLDGYGDDPLAAGAVVALPNGEMVPVDDPSLRLAPCRCAKTGDIPREVLGHHLRSSRCVISLPPE